jgi:RHS repeat-associated protein
MASADKATSRSDGEQRLAAPSISLPKGGGALRGIGEKFAANPVTGTGSMTVPLAASPGRAGFGPHLALAYDSGAGNGPFGFGWSLALPAITRKTDKGLPRYDDAAESDSFLLSGAEDLVPAAEPDDATSVPGFRICRYRPRIEGLFARIECWTKVDDPGDVHWRSISRDNILTLYGKDAESRFADPDDPSHIFSWLICETRDDRGNAILYRYKAEDGTNVDLARAHEANRGGEDDPRRKANRYLKRILYGNRAPLLVDGKRPRFLGSEQLATAEWLFEVVFDYGEHEPLAPKPGDAGAWTVRSDPFSTYRPGFELRTYRLCRRVLMFHHFPAEEGVGADCLVRSTDFTYSHERAPDPAFDPIYSCLASVTQSGYVRQGNGYLKRSLPPVDFEYTRAVVQSTVEEVNPGSLENLPTGLGAGYQWTDLHGEGIPGILTEQGGAWFYKRNLSPINARPNGGNGHNGDGPAPGSAVHTEALFAPVEQVATKPNLSLGSGAQFIDLASDGQPDLVVLDGPLPGLFEHDEAESWSPFKPFSARLNRAFADPNLRLVDLDGDGHADVLITEDDAFVWYPSLKEDGFGPALRVSQPFDEEQGPRLVFADREAAVYLADMSGDGLVDLVRIRNGEVCYWPNRGYGRFGAKVAMDNAPCFDAPDGFDQRRVHLADIDGSGTTDLIYVHPHGVRLYFNQSGNGWGLAIPLPVFPHVDSLTDIAAVDLLGNGTACLVWSSPLLVDSRRPMRYVNLMGDEKPHLLVKSVNNLGAETRVHYAPSTKFYLLDKLAGRPWITRLPFPVHVVERIETYDHVSRNRFVTTYAYHHGYFDGEEREFRGFAMVEQTDTEEFGALTAGGTVPATNENAASHVPPSLTRTWFHTGVYLGRDRVSRFFAGLLDGTDLGEYYREPSLSDDQAKALLLDDTVLPDGLTLDEERQAARSLKGMMLRQEVYALDAVGVESDYPFGQPYTVTEQSFTVRLLQHARQDVEGHTTASNRHHAVFFSHPREALTFHYEREPSDPRVQHALTLAVDEFGNVLKAAAIGYGRRRNSTDSALTDEDRAKQRLIHITATENTFTNAVDDMEGNYRTPLPAESATYELRKPEQERSPDGLIELYRFADVLARIEQAGDGIHDIAYEDIDFEAAIQAGEPEKDKTFRRLIERVRTLYRKDDLSGLGDEGELEPLALPGESYKLALTPELLARVFKRRRAGQPDEDLLPLGADLNALLEGLGADAGGYKFMDGAWWIPSGRVFYSPDEVDAAELDEAREHFFLPRRFTDPFGHAAKVDYDAASAGTGPAYDLLVTRTEDAVQNVARAENDYRVLGPRLLTDPNGNRAEVRFDVLGMVTGTAIMGKPAPAAVGGDSLEGFGADLDQAQIDAFFAAPRQPHSSGTEGEATEVVHELLTSATTRILYDLDRFKRTQAEHPDKPELWLPACAATIARETHLSDLGPGDRSKLQVSFSYSDGFDREIQTKIQAEPGPTPQRDANGEIVLGPDGEPVMTATDTNHRWVSSGWTVFNNKGAPVRQYEPFFSDTHQFEFGVEVGVSPVLFYDPAGRVVATLHPDHTWGKVVFDPWEQATYDVNDTVDFDPRTDSDVRDFFGQLPDTDYLPTWRERRIGLQATDPERVAAEKATVHADTPAVAHFDALGRPFLTVAQNRFERKNGNNNLETVEEKHVTRVDLDIEGNQRRVIDARDRLVMVYDYNMLGRVIHQASMEAGERWTLNDATGNAIRAFDSRGHRSRTEYDALRRPLRTFVTGADPNEPARTLLTGRMVYGEQHPAATALNLRGSVYLALDQAGAAFDELHDFKGNPLIGSRRLAADYKHAVDWAAVDAALPPGGVGQLDADALDQALAPFVEDETFASRMTYDALNRPLQVIAPHSNRPGTKVNVIQPRFNEANLLEQVNAWLNQDAAPTELLDASTATLTAVTDLDHDAKGQRTLIEYGNGVRTTYEYDRLTFRLRRLLTLRSGEPLQDLHYTYDAAGNITHIQDDAQQTVFFDNQVVKPRSDYTYDAIYRLIEAAGREHLGQAGAKPTMPDAFNRFHTSLPHPGASEAMGRYTERYEYDFVGNFQAMKHFSSNPALAGWTRAYQYDKDSLLEPGKKSNRLSSTTIGTPDDQLVIEAYTYDAHGNTISMLHLPLMAWDDRNQLQATSQQVRNDGTPETTYYIYDGSGQRTRKVTERQAEPGQTPIIKEERLYLGGFEVFRQYSGDGSAVTLERETLHLMDDQQRIALVETKTVDTFGQDISPQRLIRFQLGNHLGSAVLEVDSEAQIISYEEYFPYGSTSYRAVRSQTETPKRYCYTGKERDEETGLYYHGARYYAPWLGRWTACDPAGITDGTNLYAYVKSAPIDSVDPTGTDARRPSLRQMEQRLKEINTEIAETEATLARYATAEAKARANLTEAQAAQAGIQKKLVAARADAAIKREKANQAIQKAQEAAEKAARSSSRATRARGGLKVLGGGAAFAAGAGLCATFIGCIVGAPLMILGSDVAGSGVTEVATGGPAPTFLGQVGGPSVQRVEEDIVNAAGTAFPFSRYAAATRPPIVTPPAAGDWLNTNSRIVPLSTDRAVRNSTAAMAQRTGHAVTDLAPGSLNNVDDITVIAHSVTLDKSSGAWAFRVGRQPYTSDQLAQALVDAGWKGGTVRLAVCKAGMSCLGGPSLGQELANDLSVLRAESAVISPVGKVNVLDDALGLPQVRGSSGDLLPPGQGWDVNVKK